MKDFIGDMLVPIIVIVALLATLFFAIYLDHKGISKRQHELNTMRVVNVDGHQYVFIGEKHYHAETCNCKHDKENN